MPFVSFFPFHFGWPKQPASRVLFSTFTPFPPQFFFHPFLFFTFYFLISFFMLKSMKIVLNKFLKEFLNLILNKN
ncbi:unnamed protein product [Meloidogyne enterolobii]|uniref:Uncharacterized protein n=1 Tax=Meloidogyne enterolobii TaxID=390850 RepID=A0ACB0XPA7_MELEN